MCKPRIISQNCFFQPMGKENHPPSSQEHLDHKGNSEGRHDLDTMEIATPSMGTSWLGMACVYCRWTPTLQKLSLVHANPEGPCRNCLGSTTWHWPKHVRDLSNTVTVCAIEQRRPGMCSGTVLFTSLYVNSNAEIECSYVSHCGAVSELALTTSSHNIDRLERRGTGRKNERNVMKNGLNAGPAHLDPVLLKVNI